MKTKKKILIPIIIIALLVGAFFGARALRTSTASASLIPVSSLNMRWWDDPTSMDGMVYDSDSQSVHVSSTQIITDIYVTAGQEVKAGDPLMAFDMTSQEITLQLKELAVLRVENDLENAYRELNKLQNTTPVPEPSPIPLPEPDPVPVKPVKKQINDAWNYLDGRDNDAEKYYLDPVILHQEDGESDNSDGSGNGGNSSNSDGSSNSDNTGGAANSGDDKDSSSSDGNSSDGNNSGSNDQNSVDNTGQDNNSTGNTGSSSDDNGSQDSGGNNSTDTGTDTGADTSNNANQNDNPDNAAGTSDSTDQDGSNITDPSTSDNTEPDNSGNTDGNHNITPEPTPIQKPEPKPVTVPDPGTLYNPLRYLVSEDGKIYGSFLNELKEKYPKSYVLIEVRNSNIRSGALLASWTLYTDLLTEQDPDAAWSISMRPVEDDTVDDMSPVDDSPVYQEGYTAIELAAAIYEQQRLIKDLDLSLRRARLDLSMHNDQMEDGVVKAKRNGTVTVLGDPNNLPQDGSPFLKVEAGSGIFIQSSISELLLDTVNIGQPVIASSWETGMSYEGTISSIDEYPMDNNYYYYGGNPNSSSYGFLAYFEDAEDLRTGDWIQISLMSEEEASDTIYLPTAYVRSDHMGKYVMMDQNGRLAKKYVQTGKSYYGEIIQILDGITMEDYLAFPYGDGATEGAKTVIDEDEMIYW